jgi:L-threonylcarbamoyladenylate synthase
LIENLGHPVAAPSANKFGKTSPTTAQHVRDELGDKIAILDGGPCEVGIESTVLEIVDGGNIQIIRILRPGMIQEADLRLALEGLNFEIEFYKLFQHQI